MSSTMMPTMLNRVAIPTPFSNDSGPRSHQPRTPSPGPAAITTRNGRPGTAGGLRARKKRRWTNPLGVGAGVQRGCVGDADDGPLDGLQPRDRLAPGLLP